jgi:hypothetical protein
MSDAVYIPFVHQHLDAERRFRASDELEAAATLLLAALERYEAVLRPLRAAVAR